MHQTIRAGPASAFRGRTGMIGKSWDGDIIGGEGSASLLYGKLSLVGMKIIW